MSKFSKSVLKLARENPEFRQALLEEMSAKKADRDGNYMSRQALQQISVQAQELLGMIDPSTELEDWMEAKFIRAAGMLTSAYNAMKYGDSKTASHKHLYGDDLVESLELLARLGPDWTPAQKRAAKEIAKAIAKGDKATVRRHMRALDTTSIYNEISNWVDFS